MASLPGFRLSVVRGSCQYNFGPSHGEAMHNIRHIGWVARSVQHEQQRHQRLPMPGLSKALVIALLACPSRHCYAVPLRIRYNRQ